VAVWPGWANSIRIATYNVSLGRDGPGLLARDIAAGKDPQIETVAEVIARTSPDILLLNDFDYDRRLIALGLFAEKLADKGERYPYLFALRPNAGMASGVDLDGDGRTAGPGDAQGFGDFPGSQGMAILSKYPIMADAARDFSALLWADLPDAVMPVKNGKPFPSANAQRVQRLSSKGHWDVPVALPGGRVLHVLASHPTPPVFDGPEDLNGARNRDELRFWQLYLDGRALAGYPPRAPASFVIIGDLNADPNDGEGSHPAIQTLLSHQLVQDPAPSSDGAKAAAARQGKGNTGHKTPPRLETVDWDETRTPGNMRVDYVLPSIDLRVTGSGVFWPAPGQPGYDLVGSSGDVGSHHRLVWVDIGQ